MLDWKTWCRLCGNYEVSEKIEPEIEKIAEQLFVIPSDQAFICLDCKAYVQDLNSFLTKARSVGEMFEELENIEQRGESTDEALLQLRLNFNLPIPEVQFIEEEELAADFNEIECFKLVEDESDDISGFIQEEEAEYLENDEIELEVTEIKEESPEMNVQMYEENFDEEDFVDEEMIFHEDAVDAETFIAEKFGVDYNDEIAKHFDLRCHVCNEEFKKMYFLTTHTQTAHDCLPRVPCKCGRFIGSTKALIDHYENHIANNVNFRCTDCNKSYKTQTHYNNHMMTHHSQSDKSDNRKFTCECGKSFKEMRHLTAHQNSHLPNELKFIHHCTYCDRRYSSIFSLRQHIKHIHVKEANFQCQFCRKAFSRKANLDSHVSHVHTTERKFNCDICGLKLKTKSILRVHKKIHSTNPEDFLPCEVCQKLFKTQNQLINHMICHSDMKKYKCTVCDAEYKRSKELSCHIASVHTKESSYTCTYCSKNFYNNSNYRKHKLKMHAKEMELKLFD